MYVKRLKGGNVLVKHITKTNIQVSSNSNYSNSNYQKLEEEERIKNLLRMRKERFISKALNIQFNYFITLTYDPKKYNDLTFKKSVKLFFQRYIAQYILVEERHNEGKGNIHFHCLIKDIPFKLTKHRNHLKTEKFHWGHYDIKYIDSTSENYEAIILYLAKYMTKTNDYKTNPYTYSKNLKSEYKLKDISKLIRVNEQIINEGIQETYLTNLQNISF